MKKNGKLIRNGRYPVVEIPYHSPQKRSDKATREVEAVASGSKFVPRKRRRIEEIAVSSSSSRAPSPDLLDTLLDSNEQYMDWVDTATSGSSTRETSPSATNTTTPHLEDNLDDTPAPGARILFSPELDLEVETANLVVSGETVPNIEDKSIPVRFLDDFTIFDAVTLEMISIEDLLKDEVDLKSTRTHFIASGIVSPELDVDSDSDSDADLRSEMDLEYPRVKLTRILEFNTHFVNDEGEVDNQIYILTKFAWYILDRPSSVYRDYFLPFWTKHRIASLIIDVAPEDETYGDFKEGLDDETDSPHDVAFDRRVFGRSLSSGDITKEIIFYTATTIETLVETEDVSWLEKSKLGKYFLKIAAHQRPSEAIPVAHSKSKKMSLHTTVTPRVLTMGKALFDQTLTPVGYEDSAVLTQSEARAQHRHHEHDPEDLKWGKPIIGSNGFYDSVRIDGERYKRGDTVRVNPGEDANNERVKNGTDVENLFPNFKEDNAVWFGRIVYFFENKHGVKMFHIHWFEHGSRTFLREFSHPKSLFLLNECDDVHVASIFGKFHLDMLGIEDMVPDSGPNAVASAEDYYHCAYQFDRDGSVYSDLPTKTATEAAVSKCPPHKPCFSCALKIDEAEAEKYLPIKNGFKHKGLNYHPNDFVYIHPKQGQLLLIAQIESFSMDEGKVCVRHFHRYDDRPERTAEDVLEERRLYRGDRVTTVAFEQLSGVCFVTLERIADELEWSCHDVGNRFYVQEGTESYCSPAGSLVICKSCMATEKEARAALESIKVYSKLRGLELFAGAGGLATGYENSGHVEMKWVVEIMKAASLTHQYNHRNTIVYNQDSNKLLRHAIDEHDGKHPAPLRNLHDNTELPSMPQPGEVDFMSAGLPCQTFSGANTCKDPNDPRTPLMLNMLSYVEFYLPVYFQLENVVGLLHHPLKSKLEGRRLKDGFTQGALKTIVCILLSLGYQVQFKVLQAAQYGAPQTRARVVLWATRRGIKVPSFPEPTHVCEARINLKHKIQGMGGLTPPTRKQAKNDMDVSAPLPSVTIEKAIGDLPKFDWVNPHREIPATTADQIESKRRAKLGILQVKVMTGCDAALPSAKKYSHPPQNAYQYQMRAGNLDSEEVAHHYTLSVSPKTVEQVCSVPLTPNASHIDTDRKLWLPRFKNPATNAPTKQKHVVFRRGDGIFFATAMTVVNPASKGSQVMHPSQRRIYTVAEGKRSQGFPDSYVFLSDKTTPKQVVEDQFKQIGNAVPVPLALALGRALGEALVAQKQVEEKEAWRKESSPEV